MRWKVPKGAAALALGVGLVRGVYWLDTVREERLAAAVNTDGTDESEWINRNIEDVLNKTLQEHRERPVILLGYQGVGKSAIARRYSPVVIFDASRKSFQLQLSEIYRYLSLTSFMLSSLGLQWQTPLLGNTLDALVERAKRLKRDLPLTVVMDECDFELEDLMAFDGKDLILLYVQTSSSFPQFDWMGKENVLWVNEFTKDQAMGYLSSSFDDLESQNIIRQVGSTVKALERVKSLCKQMSIDEAIELLTTEETERLYSYFDVNLSALVYLQTDHLLSGTRLVHVSYWSKLNLFHSLNVHRTDLQTVQSKSLFQDQHDLPLLFASEKLFLYQNPETTTPPSVETASIGLSSPIELKAFGRLLEVYPKVVEKMEFLLHRRDYVLDCIGLADDAKALQKEAEKLEATRLYVNEHHEGMSEYALAAVEVELQRQRVALETHQDEFYRRQNAVQSVLSKLQIDGLSFGVSALDVEVML